MTPTQCTSPTPANYCWLDITDNLYGSNSNYISGGNFSSNDAGLVYDSNPNPNPDPHKWHWDGTNLDMEYAPSTAVPSACLEARINGLYTARFESNTYSLAPERFMLCMIEAGFLLDDLIYWHKTSAQPNTGNRTLRNIEYLMKFSLNRTPYIKPYNDFTWLSELEGIGFENSKIGNGNGIKLSSFMNLKSGIVTTSPANTLKLREACKLEGFYLEHGSTYPPEIPYMCIKNSCRENSHIVDLYNGCGNTAKAALYANMGITYHGFEINPLYVRASVANLNLDFPDLSQTGNTIPFNSNNNKENQHAA
ncbi:MAG: DNA methyltransferase [Bacteroidota bacterium]